MDLISVGFVQNSVMQQYGKHPNLRMKSNDYFTRFTDNYTELDYVWYEGKMFVAAKHSDIIKGDIEETLNKQIFPFGFKTLPPESVVEVVDYMAIKDKMEERRLKKIKEKADKKQKIKDDFKTIIDNVKKGVEGHRIIGAFDLEFWEHNNEMLLEFGWCIDDYKTGKRKTTHLIVQENLNRTNSMFTTGNKFSRKDSQIVPLKVAKERFQKEFLDVTELMVGHGLNNDIKVLQANGINIKQKYVDTSIVGSVLMNRTNMVSLTHLLNFYKIKHGGLHNAATDVEFTMKAFFEMGDL